MIFILNLANKVACSCKYNPVFGVLTIMVFYLWFNILEAMIETLIFGDRFEHWLDPFFIVLFMAFSGLVVDRCAYHHYKESDQ